MKLTPVQVQKGKADPSLRSRLDPDVDASLGYLQYTIDQVKQTVFQKEFEDTLPKTKSFQTLYSYDDDGRPTITQGAKLDKDRIWTFEGTSVSKQARDLQASITQQKESLLALLRLSTRGALQRGQDKDFSRIVLVIGVVKLMLRALSR